MKVNLIITSSKILSYLIFIVGSVFGFYYNSTEVIITSFTVSASLLGVKTWIDRKGNISNTNVDNSNKENIEVG